MEALAAAPPPWLAACGLSGGSPEFYRKVDYLGLEGAADLVRPGRRVLQCSSMAGDDGCADVCVQLT